MDVKKIKIGIAVDKDVLEKLDKIANASAYLDTSRSEIINVILRAFFKSNVNQTEKARELVIRYRKDLL
ncbi:MAG: ribbon-helix-helix domain-containing protein [Thermoplasmata archaeon]|jgi:metal-responsive CopG/Arc/MetJ family transcriptional regulator|nr:ribbon-helix-helix domain-containing protein [Thermoplasmata archaeon]